MSDVKLQVVVDVHRASAGYWTANLKDLDGSVVHGRSLSQLRTEIQRALRRSGRNPTHIQVVEVLHLSADLTRSIVKLRDRRLELEHQNLALRQELGRIVRKLGSQLHVSVRDTGVVLGISAPYVHELRQAPRGRPPVKLQHRAKQKAEVRLAEPTT